MVITVASPGPDWASIMTAFGTVAAAAAAVGIALWTDRQAGRRISAERARADRQLADEQAHSRATLDEERRIVRDREQLGEAYTIEVSMVEKIARKPGTQTESAVKKLAVIVVNHGRFTITRLEAQFSYDGKSLAAYAGYLRESGYPELPVNLAFGWSVAVEQNMSDVLRPWDRGVRFESGEVAVQFLKNPYPIVRWTDRWGTRWEHRLGEVRRISDGDNWKP